MLLNELLDDEQQITRVEVIGDEGRRLVLRVDATEMWLQDDGRTLKVFVSGDTKPNNVYKGRYK
jgi:hypothetical protein